LKDRRRKGVPGPQKGGSRSKDAQRPILNVTGLAAQLKRADDLLSRGRKEVKRLRKLMPRSSSRNLSQQLLANLEALLSLQIAHRGYLLQQLRAAKRPLRKNQHTRKGPKRVLAGGLVRGANRTRTNQPRQ